MKLTKKTTAANKYYFNQDGFYLVSSKGRTQPIFLDSAGQNCSISEVSAEDIFLVVLVNGVAPTVLLPHDLLHKLVRSDFNLRICVAVNSVNQFRVVRELKAVRHPQQRGQM